MCPISGGNWSNGSNAGVWAFNLNNTRTNSNNNVGFRADSASPRMPQGTGGSKGEAFRRAAVAAAANWAGRLLSGSARRAAMPARCERQRSAHCGDGA